jgi:hypothetical protein
MQANTSIMIQLSQSSVATQKNDKKPGGYSLEKKQLLKI